MNRARIAVPSLVDDYGNLQPYVQNMDTPELEAELRNNTDARLKELESVVDSQHCAIHYLINELTTLMAKQMDYEGMSTADIKDEITKAIRMEKQVLRLCEL